MGLVSCLLSEEYLINREYVSSLRSEITAIGSSWQELNLLQDNLNEVPEQAGVFILFFKDLISSSEANLYTRNIVFIGGEDGGSLRHHFSELLSIFESRSISNSKFSADILKFEMRCREGDLIFSFITTEAINIELVKAALNKLKKSYSPIGNKVPMLKLDHSKIEPAF